ncbi:penicillin-binding protein activator [Sulfitobacter sabulilitoris]|uniref:Penicillin-binding protein activator n=1 Tax=Sulfitobacter sabulilitoris TaxID=2562655 RepID=A0A5S3PBN4_9RHOB|nr:penicillin-binding protein activator [Sulfitobacter sabulilitoris]TMM51100.1 penicillin-binding protein activator [Sulfitobacter sabulilitoris]
MIAVFRSARKALRRLVLPIAALALAACEPVSIAGLAGGGGPKIDTQAPVPVALLVPRGSGSAGDDILAQSLENAARLAMRDLEGVEIDLRVYATAGNASTAAAQAVQAVNDGAKIILGPVYAEAANAAGAAVANRGVNVLSFSNNTSIAGGNVFVLGPTFQNTANRLVGYAAAQGRDRIVIVHAQDVAGEQGRAAISQAAAANGASIVGSVPYVASQQGVVSAVSQVKSTVDGSGANALFLTTSSASALPLLSQLLPEAGVRPDAVQYIGLTRWDIPPQTLSLPGVQGGWFALPDPGASGAFSARYSAAYGQAPHPIGGLGFDGIAAVGALVSAGKSDALTASALTQGAGFRGATGVFRLNRNGTNQRGLAVATIRDQQVSVLDPAPRSFGGAGF